MYIGFTIYDYNNMDGKYEYKQRGRTPTAVSHSRDSHNSTSVRSLTSKQPAAKIQFTNPNTRPRVTFIPKNIIPIASIAPRTTFIKKLRENRTGINQTVTNLLEVLLQATCAVSSFHNALEGYRRTAFAEESKLFVNASIKDIAELRLLDIIKQRQEWNNLNPTDFLVKVFANLDALKGEGEAIGSIFSTCTNNIAKCLTCNSWKSISLNLGVLKIIALERFESEMSADEKSYFNTTQPALTELSVQEKEKCDHLPKQRIPKKTLELLLADSYCIQPEDTKWCLKCNRKTIYKNLKKLQSLSPGLIVQLSTSWEFAGVPESINLRDCPAAHATYHLRAAVLQIPNSRYSNSGHWVCVEKLTDISSQASLTSHLLLFYEREVPVVLKLKMNEGALDVQQQSRLVGLNQQLNQEILIANQEREIAAKNLAHQRSIAVDPKGKWECVGPTAAFEAAIRGLFTIRAFTAFLETNPFTTEQLRDSPFLREFNTIYSQECTLGSRWENLMDVLRITDNFLHIHITKFLTQFDRTIPRESGNTFPRTDSSVLPKLKSERQNSCQALHDIFSVLMKNNSRNATSWTYSCYLDIPLNVGPNQGSIVDLEKCVLQWGKSKQSDIFYLGSALIIRLFKEGSTRSQRTLVRVPKTLDMNKLGIIDTPVYHLRAVIYSPEGGQSATFIVQKISDDREINKFLEKGCNADLLLYEQETTISAYKKADDFISDEPPNHVRANLVEMNPVQGCSKWEELDQNTENGVFEYGLQNLGNTCFMNAALNGLYSLRSFREYFTTQRPEDDLLLALFQFCRMHTQKQVQPEVLYKFKRAIAEFSDGRQHCANSYTFKILMLLDTLIPSQSETTFPQDIFGNKLRQYRRGKCELLHDIFSALIENLFICKKCPKTRRNFSYFRTVDVPIPYSAATNEEMTVFSPNNFYPGKLATLYNGNEASEEIYRQKFLQQIKEFKTSASVEILSGTDLSQCFKYMLRASLMSPTSLMHCDGCGFETQHYKQSFFRQLSTCFVIHFQRFDERTGRKLDTPIDFPMNLDMSEYCVNDPRKYHLCGVVYHFGSLDFGHYTACIKVRGRWYNVNDSSVEVVKEKPPIENAYMLFYEEIAHPPTLS